MTRESISQGQNILNKIDYLNKVIEDIRPRLNEGVILRVSISHSVIQRDPIEYELRSDGPLFVTIVATIKGMIVELEEQLKQLDGNSTEKSENPIIKTSFWKKAGGDKDGDYVIDA